MRIPLEYGDNFPVPCGGWDPHVPWRFPRHEVVKLKQPSFVAQVMPWLMLGAGVTLGVLWMSWRSEVVHAQSVDAPGSEQAVLSEGMAPAQTPAVILRSRTLKVRSSLA